MGWQLRENLFTSPVRLDQGTTPTIVVELGDEILVSNLVEIWFYIYNVEDDLMCDKDIEDMVLDVENNTIMIPLSQEDTNALEAGDGKLEIRLLDFNDEAYKSDPIKVDIMATGKSGVISVSEPEPEVVVEPNFERGE